MGSEMIFAKEMEIDMFLRKAEESDAGLLLEWSNDPVTRQNSFSQDKITWENHIRWFKKKLEDKACLFYIAEDEAGNRFGTIRVDFDEDFKTGTISYSVAPGHRKKGVGTKLIGLCENALKDENISCTLAGAVKADNISSIRCFQKNDFSLAKETKEELVFQKNI